VSLSKNHPVYLDKDMTMDIVQKYNICFNGAMLEEAKIVAVTKIVLYLMEQNGHWSS
jgi:hypothetical protein